MHLNNVALHNNSYLFFDWTDSCISHPFFDLFALFLESDRKTLLGHITGLWEQKYKKRLRDRYLSQWTKYEPKERLLDAWNIAKPLCFLHHAVTYQYMLSNLEPRAKQEINALPYFLRKIIKHNR